MPSSAARLEWLKSLQSAAQQAGDSAEAGLHFLGASGEEHLRDATERWLEHNRSFAAKLDRRIKLEAKD